MKFADKVNVFSTVFHISYVIGTHANYVITNT